jgi:hypothetical protein
MGTSMRATPRYGSGKSTCRLSMLRRPGHRLGFLPSRILPRLSRSNDRHLSYLVVISRDVNLIVSVSIFASPLGPTSRDSESLTYCR